MTTTVTLMALVAVAAAVVVALGVWRRGAADPLLMPGAHAPMTQDTLPHPTPSELREWLSRHPDAVLLDVRTPAEFAEGHLAGAVNLDIHSPDFAARAAALARGTPYMLYCRSGARSARAGRHLLELGHAPVVNGGGLAPLAREGLPVARGSQGR